MHKIAVLDDDVNWSLSVQRFLRKEFLVTVFTDPNHFFAVAAQYDLVIVDFVLDPLPESENKLDGYGIIHRLKSSLERPPLCLLASGWIDRNDLASISQRPYFMADDLAAKDAGLDVILAKVRQLLGSTLPQSTSYSQP
ncbi:response regulator transcription factor [Trichocoleus sp. FACHB-262]|uniref:response regulator transcription factor n=1 Tax=Trichocoleus sp. FACHB-262 TaxID=2692869 RepID=UPI0019A1C3CF|nr:response regulator transcription factor [Trichocoleus sp. FACHB-262]MBD2119493.1 response regulator transcription factor [Trichocoleus sp. FACHB-262]